jgi:hypothetical protein
VLKNTFFEKCDANQKRLRTTALKSIERTGQTKETKLVMGISGSPIFPFFDFLLLQNLLS